MAGITSLHLSNSFRPRSSFPTRTASRPFRLPTRIRILPGMPLRSRFTRIYAFSSNDIKVGSNIEVDGAPWRVIEFLHVKPGKGAAFVRTKVRNYMTGNTVEKTFRAGSTIQEADIVKETRQYTYKDGDQYVFMDLSSFEESRLGDKEVGDKKKWLKEGMDCILLLWNGSVLLFHFCSTLFATPVLFNTKAIPKSLQVIDFELPITVKLTVVDVDPGLRGDTAQGGSKPATLDTGAIVNVPLFVNIGDDILVDTRTGQYMSRA